MRTSWLRSTWCPRMEANEGILWNIDQAFSNTSRGGGLPGGWGHRPEMQQDQG